jgi:hypothetical protein
VKKTLASAFGFIILMFNAIVLAAPVPDTGVTKCYSDIGEITCPSPGQPFYGQDAVTQRWMAQQWRYQMMP